MCVYLKKDFKINIATKPILVYKNVYIDTQNMCTSICKLFIYYRNRKPPVIKNFLNDLKESGNYFVTAAGYYSYSDVSERYNALFIIPKGAKYSLGRYSMDGSDDLYISDKIIYIGKDNILNRWKTRIKIWMNIFN